MLPILFFFVETAENPFLFPICILLYFPVSFCRKLSDYIHFLPINLFCYIIHFILKLMKREEP